MKNLLISLFVVLSLTATAEEKKVYKTVDEQGNVTFSDVPVEKSEEVKVPTTPTFRTPDYSSMMPEESKQAKVVDYEKIEIISPKHDQVFWSVEGDSISVAVNVEPALQAGHKLVIKLDGKPVNGTVLTNLYRGSYTLTAEVQLPDEEVLIASGPVTFHVKRHILKKKPQDTQGKTAN